MIDKNTDFFKIEDHFKETEHIPSIPIFENHLPEAPRFTIAIPTYKRAKYLKEALESAINQNTDEPFEIIVVDNNPERNDETEQLMEEYSSVLNVSYYKNYENLGMGGNWNRCFTLSNSNKTILLHDDDMIDHSFISYVNLMILEIKDFGIIQTSKTFDKNKLNAFRLRYIRKDIRKIRFKHLYLGHVVDVPSGIVYNVNIVKALGGFNQKFYPSLDYCFHTLLAYHRNKIYKTSKVLTYYRIENNESMKSSTSVGWLKVDAELIRGILKKLKLPRIIIEKYIAIRTQIRKKQIAEKWHTDVNIEIKDVGCMKEPSNFEKKIIPFIIKWYVRII